MLTFPCLQFSMVYLTYLTVKCFKLTGGMNITRIKLKISADPTFFKRRITVFRLSGLVRHALLNTCIKRLITPLEPVNWVMLVVTPLNVGNRTPRDSSEYRVTMTSMYH